MTSGIAKRFVPLMDRILVQRIKAEAKTASGIFLPDSAKKDPNWAKVLAVGPGRYSKDGELLPVNVKVGDTVVVPEYGGMALKFDTEEYQVFRDEDIVGIVTEE
mmetsp:Transcript_54230/g.129233  ORF Transcript_54230/g.129233 Transcript_54230/m.129233 type:complete len:104 (+) Transcript_54230:87-398(+)|eukprot:CAMPEP_0178403396 /NCGR_PEP_ID=MMETSP0689_2-20121128/17345_1 /TAXON_ID=160604 /ORGANISM="Amphidinium massartii, Strain CS-259" /LENGTH=103 /DNA_ID=CAMNT_0020024345 /DNA_START=81 /DNA_END=392 /DNA_ORIENTATION=+